MASKYDDDDDEQRLEEKGRWGEEKVDCHGKSSPAKSRAGGAESKGSDGLSGKELVETVQNYFFTDETLSRTFEKFVEDNAHIIDLDSEEFKLEYTQAYNDYKALFETKMESYIERTLGSSIHEFYSALKASGEEDEFSNGAIFGQILVSVTDFDIFMQMMREAAFAAKNRRK